MHPDGRIHAFASPGEPGHPSPLTGEVYAGDVADDTEFAISVLLGEV